MPPPALIVCPLQLERAGLSRSGLPAQCDIVCCGPGAEEVARWAASATIESDQPVVLAGLAGALAPDLAAGSAHVIDAVIERDGNHRLCPSLAPPAETARVLVTSSAAVVSDPDAKAALRARSGADLVDLESRRFAEIAVERGWLWTIVRGVSDDARTPLAPEMLHWVGASGRLRPGRVTIDLLRKPSHLARLGSLRRSSAMALEAVAVLIGHILSASCRPPSTS